MCLVLFPDISKEESDNAVMHGEVGVESKEESQKYWPYQRYSH